MPPDAPLRDTTILVTRPSDEAGPVAEVLAAAGARVENCPAIEFASLLEQNVAQIRPVLEALREREGWLVLPSPTAVAYFGELLARLHLDAAALTGLSIAIVGPGSATALAELGLAPAFQPPMAHGASLAEHLPAVPGQPVVILGSRQSRPELRDGLGRRGLMVQTLPLYAPRPSEAGLARLAEALASPGSSGGIRILLVTSPSGADAICDTLAPDALAKVGWLAIGPTTLRRILARGVAPEHTAEAREPRPEAIAEAAAGLAARLRDQA